MATPEGSEPRPVVPRYGEASLAEVIPSILAALGTEGFEANPLRIAPLSAACLLMIDGLGWEQLLESREAAPFMASLADAGRPVTTAFPATTATSLGSLGTGLAPGEHGLVGYTFAVPGYDRVMNALQWSLYGNGPAVDLREQFPPERVQPHATVFQRAAEAGIDVRLVGPPRFARGPLTRAVLRGGRYEGVHSLGDLIASATWPLRSNRPAFVYAYQPDLDTTGHVRGVRSDGWLEHLALLDAAVRAAAARVPPGAALFVTGDHGMVNLTEDQKLDLADHTELADGVRLLGGEARARHVYAREGAAEDVLSAWGALVGDRMWVVGREEAIESGWFGPRVSDAARDRIGDVVAASHAAVGIFQREVDSLQLTLVGHHGSMTPAEQLVPLLEARRE
jgi:hypothetical protein